MTRMFLLVAIMIVITVAQTAGQGLPNLGHVDRPAVPIEQAADVVVVLVPDETLDLHMPTPYERVVRGSIERLDKGPMPQVIVHTPNTIVTGLRAGVPAKVFLKKFEDRDVYYIIGVFAASSEKKP